MTGSRAGSPAASQPRLPTVDEIKAAVPPTGIRIAALINIFRSQIPATAEGKARFIALVKGVGRLVDGSLHLK